MSYTDREKTSSVTLDKLDFAPCSVYGFTNLEFGACLGTFTILLGLFLVPIGMNLVTSGGLYASVLSMALALPLSIAAAMKAEYLKKGRPSYMIWIDFRRYLQDKGVFGLKFNTGLVGKHVWDNTKSTPHTK